MRQFLNRQKHHDINDKLEGLVQSFKHLVLTHVGGFHKVISDKAHTSILEPLEKLSISVGVQLCTIMGRDKAG